MSLRLLKGYPQARLKLNRSLVELKSINLALYMKKAALISASLFAIPTVVFAQGLGPVHSLVVNIGRIIAALVPILITLALVVFFWGLVRYLWGGGGAKHEEGRKLMVMGLIALFVMVSVWGIIKLAQDALNIQATSGTTIPTGFVPGGGGGNPNSGSTQNPGGSGYW